MAKFPDSLSTVRRRQFPVRLSLAMTINKSQKHSLQNVGLHLARPVFAHGQLYVALSRGQDGRSGKVSLDNSDEGKRAKPRI